MRRKRKGLADHDQAIAELLCRDRGTGPFLKQGDVLNFYHPRSWGNGQKQQKQRVQTLGLCQPPAHCTRHFCLSNPWCTSVRVSSSSRHASFLTRSTPISIPRVWEEGMHHGRTQASNTSHCWQFNYAHDPGTNKDTRTPHNHTTGGVTLVPRRARCFLDSPVRPSSLAHTPPRARRRSTHHHHHHHGGQWPFRGPNGLCHAVWHGHHHVFGPGSLSVARSRQGKWVRTRTRLPPSPTPHPFPLEWHSSLLTVSPRPLSHSCLSILFTAWSSHSVICPSSPSPTLPSSTPTHPHRMASTLPRATRPASTPSL